MIGAKTYIMDNAKEFAEKANNDDMAKKAVKSKKSKVVASNSDKAKTTVKKTTTTKKVKPTVAAKAPAKPKTVKKVAKAKVVKSETVTTAKAKTVKKATTTKKAKPAFAAKAPAKAKTVKKVTKAKVAKTETVEVEAKAPAKPKLVKKLTKAKAVKTETVEADIVAEETSKPEKVKKAKSELSDEEKKAKKKAKKAKKKAKKEAKNAKNDAIIDEAIKLINSESDAPVKEKTKKAKTEKVEVAEDEDSEKDGKSKVTFADLGLDSVLLDALAQKGYVTPSPIQEQVIPLLLEGGVDVIGQAQTGTGKTAAFGLPILQNLEEGFNQTQALILTPTRELAIQVANEINSFKGKKRFNIVTVYGGQPIMQQIRDLGKGADIVVGTPGRVIDLMKRGKLRTGQVEYFILDEADEMLNMGFIDDIEWIMEECNEDKQMLLFSATMPNKIKKLAHKYMPNYELVAVKSKEVTTQNTEQLYYPVFPKDRFKVLERILLMEPDFYGIIFSNTKLTADDITRKLLKDGIKAEALHGDIAQNQRERILKRFKDKQCNVLVATDVAARGIDVNDLTHVINYGLPQDSEAYVHRIGRTGRAGKKGIAISLVTNQDHKQLQAIESIAKTKIKRAELPSADTLVELRKGGIVEEILATEVHARDRHFQEIAEKLMAEDNMEEVLVQVIKNAYGKQLNVSKFNPIKQPKTLDGNDTDEMRLFVAYGKSEGYNNEKIEEYFIEKAGVDHDVFLDVYVLDEFSFITVPTEVGTIILDKFRSIKKNGREIVTKAKAKGGGGGGSRGGSSRGGFGGGNRGGGRDRDNRSSGGGRDRDRRSGGGERSYGGGDRRSSGGRSNDSGGERRSSRSSEGGYERRSSRSSDSGSSDKGSSFGGFSNNYGPKKKSFNSKSRKRD